MTCTKRQLVDLISSYATARVTGDTNLINISAQLLQAALETIEFQPEPEGEKAGKTKEK